MNVSFKSTPSCNIVSVNAPNGCTNFVELCDNGKGKHKLQWVI